MIAGPKSRVPLGRVGFSMFPYGAAINGGKLDGWREIC